MADSTARSAEEFLALSQRASACVVYFSDLVSSARLSKGAWPSRVAEIADFRRALELLAGELGDSLARIDKYAGTLATVPDLPYPFVLGGKKHVSGHAVAFRLAHDVIWAIWFAADNDGMPLTWEDPTKAEHVNIGWAARKLKSRRPAPFDPAALLPDNLPPKKWEKIKASLLKNPSWAFPADELSARIELERHRVAKSLGVKSPADDKSKSPGKKTPRKSTSTIDRDLKYLDEYGRGYYSTVAAFADSKKIERPTMRAALKRASEFRTKQGRRNPSRRG